MRNKYTINALQYFEMFFKVDLEFSSDLYYSDNDYLLAPELLKVKAYYHSDNYFQVFRKYYGRGCSN